MYRRIVFYKTQNLSSPALDLEHQTIPEDTVTFQSINLEDGVDGADGGKPAEDPPQSVEDVQKQNGPLNRQTSSNNVFHKPLSREGSSDRVVHKPPIRQGSRERILEKVQKRRLSRQLSRQLIRQASQDALENQEANGEFDILSISVALKIQGPLLTKSDDNIFHTLILW